MKNLTQKETEVLQRVADGEDNRYIAIRIGTTYFVVRNILVSIREKLEASRTENAVATGIRRGIID